MSGGSFGRKGSVDGAALAARRAAFLAEERARAQHAGEAGGIAATPRTTSGEPVFVREKTMGTAYLLWFFLGGISVHRFYLGFSTSGAIQAGLAPVAYAMLFAGSLFGAVPLVGAGIWILADAFLIPGLTREANARIRRNATASVFA